MGTRIAHGGPAPEEAGAREHLPGMVKGAAINLGGSAFGKLLALLHTVIIARLLIPAEVGLFYICYSLFSIVNAVAIFGLDSGMLRYVPIFRARNDPAGMKGVVKVGVALACALGLGTAAALILIARPLAEGVFGKPELVPLIRAVASAVPFFVVGTVLLSGTQAIGRMQYQVYVRQLLEPGLRVAVTTVLLLLGLRIWGVVSSYVFSTVIGCFLALTFQQRLFAAARASARWPAEWREILAFSLPRVLSRVVLLLLMWTDTLMLGYLETTEQVGLYSIAARTAYLGMLVVDAFNVMFAPIISGLHEKGAMDRLGDAFKSVTKWSLTAGGPILLVLLVLPREVLAVYGGQYEAAWLALAILAAAQVVNTMTGPVAQVLIMSGRSWIDLANNLGVALLNVVFNLVLIPRFGIAGAAGSTALSAVLLNVMRIVQVRWLMGMQPYRWTILKPLLAGAAACGLALLTTNLLQGAGALTGLVAGATVLLVAYAGLLLLLPLDADDRFVFERVRAKLTGSRVA